MDNKRLEEILSAITVICDTRENENSHILDCFDKYKIKTIEKGLKFGDYSFICPMISELGFNEEISFESRIVVERKANLTELSGNLAQYRERFENELQKAQAEKAKFILMVEDGSYNKIIKHEYNTNFNERSYTASLFSYQFKYGIEVQFIEKKLAAWYMFNMFKYYLRNELKQILAFNKLAGKIS